MIRRISVVLTLTIMAAVANVATAGSTQMVVPSRTNTAALNALSQKTNVIADVLTIDRREHLLHLSGGEAGVLVGQKLSPESVSEEAAPSTIRIPFDQIALVYFRKIPASANSQSPVFNYPAKRTYPAVASIGAADWGTDCGGLDLDIARTGTIRWYARQDVGALPFTEHEARVQHLQNGAKYAEDTLLLAAGTLIGMMGGGAALSCSFCSAPGAPVDLETWRWAVTAADRREVGLLQLKHKRTCAAVKSPDAATTDLEILSKIDATREALAAHQISDFEQRDQQTKLLDQLDPPSSARVRVATASEFAAAATAANEKKSEALWGATLTSYRRYLLVEAKSSGCTYPTFGWPLALRPTQIGGPFAVRERALSWTREHSEDMESLKFEDIKELRPTERHYGYWFIPIRKADGACLFINLTNDSSDREGDPDRTLQETARSSMLAPMTQRSK